MTTIPPRLRLFGTWVYVAMLVLATYAFGGQAWASAVADSMSWNTTIYSLAALGTLSMALRHGSEAIESSRRTNPSSAGSPGPSRRGSAG